MTTRTIVLITLSALSPAAGASPSYGHARHELPHAAVAAQRVPLAEARAALRRAWVAAPPAPAGVTDLDFALTRPARRAATWTGSSS